MAPAGRSSYFLRERKMETLETIHFVNSLMTEKNNLNYLQGITQILLK